MGPHESSADALQDSPVLGAFWAKGRRSHGSRIPAPDYSPASTRPLGTTAAEVHIEVDLGSDLISSRTELAPRIKQTQASSSCSICWPQCCQRMNPLLSRA
ncbi:hypothetical protein KIL84_019677 [Mauremys mutica]|uniref:Uncharacterized protein n=1 Tax=Mauremys mutica TaxID=74926 RepID=A0A9D4BA85_9SAUR|nr:hypothetical protein KIL84_019677 [Mauremys mutica]